MKRKTYWLSAALLCLLLVCLPVYAQASQAVEQTDTVDGDVPVITVEKQKVEMIQKPELVDADGNKDIAAPDALRTDVSYVYPCEGVVTSKWRRGTRIELPFYEYSRGVYNGSGSERIYIQLLRGGTVVASYTGQFEKEQGWYCWEISIDGSENWWPRGYSLVFYSTNDRGNRDKKPMPIMIFHRNDGSASNYVMIDEDVWEQHFDCGVLESCVFTVHSLGFGGETYYIEISDENKTPLYRRTGKIPLKHGTTVQEIHLEGHLRPGTYYLRGFSSRQLDKQNIYYPFYIDNKGVAWSYQKENGTLTFFGSGEMEHYSAQPWDSAYGIKSCEDVHHLVVEPGVTSVSEGLCKGYSGLETVSLPQGLKTIGKDAFYGCALETAALPNSVSTVGNGAFAECGKLTSITTFGDWQAPDADAEGIQANAFSAPVLETAEIPKSIQKMDRSSFFQAKKLKTVYFQDNAPIFDAGTFTQTLEMTAYYPRQLSSWSESVRQDYCGNVRWQGYDLPMGKVTLTKTLAHTSGNIIYWDAVRHANLYQVYRREANETNWILIQNTRSLAYKDTSAKCDVKYYYKVRARNGSWMSSLDIRALSATRPYGLEKAEMVTAYGIKAGICVSWQAVEGAKYYQIFRCAENETEWKLIANAASNSFWDATPLLDVEYAYKARARDGDLMSSLDIAPVYAHREYPLDRVRIKQTIAHTTGNILYWDPVENAKIYQVYRRAEDEDQWTLIKNTGSLGYKDTEALPGVKYYYDVVARNGEDRSEMNTREISMVRP